MNYAYNLNSGIRDLSSVICSLTSDLCLLFSDIKFQVAGYALC
jgi:hypothetical protein